MTSHRAPVDPAHRAALVVTGLATLGFAALAAWDLDAPFGAGHYTASAAIATAGENMLRWGIVAPVTSVVASAPSAADHYCHHPWGVFWISALFAALFGHHDWVCRLPGVLASAATVPVLYALGRSLWSPVAGAAAACGFVVLPIALSFASFHSLEVHTILGVLLFALGLVRLRRDGRRGSWALVIGGLFYALHADWPAYVLGALAIAVTTARALVPGDAEPRRRELRLAAALAVTCLATGGFYVAAFHASGQLEALFEQASMRSEGASTPLLEVLAARRYWLELSFTWPGFVLGGLGLVVVVARSVMRPREDEWIPLALFATATFQYLAFKQAADIHAFWPHHFAAFVALGLGALAATLEPHLARVLPGPGRAGLATLALCVVVTGAILPDGLRVLRFARETGGRWNERGLPIRADLDLAAALAHAGESMPAGAPLVVDHTIPRSYFVDWSLQRPVRPGSPPIHDTPHERFFLTDSRATSPFALDALAERYAIRALGPYWLVDTERAAAPIEAFALRPYRPEGLARVLRAGAHPLFRLEPDAFATWERREHAGQPAPPPSASPRTLEEVRIAHNVAVARGDREGASRLFERLLGALDREPACTEPDGTRILGARLEREEAEMLSVYVLASAPRSPLARFETTGIDESAPRGSWLPADPRERTLPAAFGTAPSRWRAGFVYAATTEVLPRPGTERIVGRWTGRREAVFGDCGEPRTLAMLEGR